MQMHLGTPYEVKASLYPYDWNRNLHLVNHPLDLAVNRRGLPRLERNRRGREQLLALLQNFPLRKSSFKISDNKVLDPLFPLILFFFLLSYGVLLLFIYLLQLLKQLSSSVFRVSQEPLPLCFLESPSSLLICNPQGFLFLSGSLTLVLCLSLLQCQVRLTSRPKVSLLLPSYLLQATGLVPHQLLLLLVKMKLTWLKLANGVDNSGHVGAGGRVASE